MEWETKSLLGPVDLSKVETLKEGVKETSFNSMVGDTTHRSPGVASRLIFTVSRWNTEWATPTAG